MESSQLSHTLTSVPLLSPPAFQLEPKATKHRPDFLFLIHSAVLNFENRQTLRTHARRYNVTVVFVLGQMGNGRGIPLTVEQESASFADLIVGSFTDCYANLTLKHLFALKWAHVNFPTVEFVVKADDDILINFREIFRVVDKKYPPSSDLFANRVGYKVIAGFVFTKMNVIRDPTSKSCATHEEYPGKVYPDFCSGWGYITTMETIESILREVAVIDRGFWIDDVFVTGMLRQRSGDVFLDPLNHKYGAVVTALRRWVSDSEPCSWNMLFSETDGIDLLKASYVRLETAREQNGSWPSCVESETQKRRTAPTGKPHVSVIHLSAFGHTVEHGYKAQ